MNSIFVIYLSANGETSFSRTYASFSQAKEAIEPFLNEYREKLGKQLRYVSKSELEAIKTPEDLIYVRKKTSQATLYHRVTNPGRIYNTYSIEKLGKVNITEFNAPESPQPEVAKKQVTVENMSHGAHGNLLVELRQKIDKMSLKRTEKKEVAVKKINSSDFIHAMMERKGKLNHVEVPERPLIV